MIRPQPRCAHRRQREPRGMEHRAEVQRDDGVPALDREVLDGRDVLDAGVVDQDVDAAVRVRASLHQLLDVGDLAQVAALEDALDAVLVGDRLDQPVDLAGVAEAVDDEIGAPGASACAIPSPMPLVEPVTTATLPFNMTCLLQGY